MFRKVRRARDCEFVRWAELVQTHMNHVIKVPGSTGPKTVDCHFTIENGVSRVDLRPLAEALGYQLDISMMNSHGIIELTKKGN